MRLSELYISIVVFLSIFEKLIQMAPVVDLLLYIFKSDYLDNVKTRYTNKSSLTEKKDNWHYKRSVNSENCLDKMGIAFQTTTRVKRECIKENTHMKTTL
jgi:hypothetical protein